MGKFCKEWARKEGIIEKLTLGIEVVKRCGSLNILKMGKFDYINS